MQIQKSVWPFFLTVQLFKTLICRKEIINKVDQAFRKNWIFRRNLLGFSFLFLIHWQKSYRSNTVLYFRNSPAATQNNDFLLHLVLHWNSFHMKSCFLCFLVLYKEVSFLPSSNGPCGARPKFCWLQLSGLQQVTKSRLQEKNARKKQ